VFGIEAEVDESVVGEGRRHEDVAAVPSVATGGTAFGDKFLAAEGHAAISSVTGLYTDSCFIDEHFSFQSIRKQGRL
jgi:hypothetical protein